MNRYKEPGYLTRTQLIVEALKALRVQKAKEARAKRRAEMLAEYSPNTSGRASMPKTLRDGLSIASGDVVLINLAATRGSETKMRTAWVV